MKQFSKKVVKVENFECGQALTIYEVRVHLIKENRDWTSDRYLNREQAEECADLYRQIHKNLYDKVWVIEHLVWCK